MKIWIILTIMRTEYTNRGDDMISLHNYVVLMIGLISGLLTFLGMLAMIEHHNEKRERISALEMSDDEFDKSMNCGGMPVKLPCTDKTCPHYGLCSAITGRKK